MARVTALEYGVVLFESTQAALKAEKVLKQAAGFPIKLIPVPRQLSSDCGVCLRFPWSERAAVEEILHSHGIDFAGLHRVE
jgi:hypothetical protein